MAFTRALLEDIGFDAFSIVANSQPEELTVIFDLGFNAGCSGVVESIAPDLARNPVHLVLKSRRQAPLCSFHDDLECRPLTLRIAGSRELFSCGRKQILQIACQRRVGTEALNCIPIFGDGFISFLDSLVERWDGLVRAIRKQVARCLKREHHALNALQERIVQFAGDPGTLIQARFGCHAVLPFHLPDTEFVRSP